MAYKVRFVNPQKHYADHRDEYLGVIDDTLAKGDLILRGQLKEFEDNFAKFVGAKYAVGVNSGFHALYFGCIAAGFGPGDEVIVPAHTFMASISAIALVGATPVLVDVEKDFNMSAAIIEKAITPKTKGIMPVHLNGRICDMEGIMKVAEKHGLKVVEDAAQALGAKQRLADGSWKNSGTFGLVGCFSMYPFKMLGAFGDAGMFVTDDPDIAYKATLLRWNGEDRESRDFVFHGESATLNNVTAALLNVKLTKYFPSWIERRREIANMYNEGLKGVTGVTTPDFSDDSFYDVWQNYIIRAERRDEIKEYFDKNELVETIVSWPRPTYKEPVMQPNELNLPETEKICKEVLSLPMYPELTDTDVNNAIAAVKDFYKA